MNKSEKLAYLQNFANHELNNNILPFWRNVVVDHEQGGFYGEVYNNLEVNRMAPKGLILNSRMLWTFSAAFKLFKSPKDKELASRAFDFITKYFYDQDYGGYYWTVTYDNQPLETKKQIYALAFTLYGMSEYFAISGNDLALKYANELLKTIEEHAFDEKENGYLEAFTRDWQEIEDLRLSDKDMNEKITMNTHLHILEAYTNLYRLQQGPFLGFQLNNLLRIFLDNIVEQNDYHLQLFFNEHWESQSSHISFGHDIEASWLLYESALALNNQDLIRETKTVIPQITEAALEGLNNLGGLIHESDRNGSHLDHEFEWWPQAEALVGFLNTYEITNNEKYLDHAIQICQFINKYMIDHEYGEWYYRVDQSGKAIPHYPKAGLWKCPYHNARACMEIIKRTENLL